MKKERTSLFLMANLGSEVSRMISAREKKDADALRGALKRSEQIIVELKVKPDMKKRLYEIEILESVITAMGDLAEKLFVSPRAIKSYFTPFALRVVSSRV